MTNVAILPLRRWPGADPEAVALALFHAEFLDDRARHLASMKQRLGRRLAQIGIGRHDRADAIAQWQAEVVHEEQRLYERAMGGEAT